MVLRLPDSWPNWNLEMLVFEERGTGVPGKKPLRAKEVAKFLDDSKRKRRLKSEFPLFQFLSIIQFHLICQMLATFSGFGSGRTISQFKNGKGNFCVVSTYCMKRAREIRNRATTAKKCTKKRDATCKVIVLLPW